MSKYEVLVQLLVGVFLPQGSREELRGLCISMKSIKDKKGVVVSFRVTKWQYLRLLKLQDLFRKPTIADLLNTIVCAMVGEDKEDQRRMDFLKREVRTIIKTNNKGTEEIGEDKI